ncbi:MAG: hypothetical protein ACYDH8_14780 [Syntrophales bacterium]
MRDRQGAIRVGLKYCGGCRAQYDRVALVDALRKRLSETVEFVAADSEEAEEILIVCGCPTACAKVGSTRPARYVKSLQDAEHWIDRVEMASAGRGRLNHSKTGKE